MKKVWLEVGGMILVSPLLIWLISFISSTYKLEAEVNNTKSDIQEIKSDVKYIRNYLLETK